MRLYCVQWCHRTRGWLDLPSLADKKEHAAIKNMEAFQEGRYHGIQMRVIRKPHGWTPPENNEEEPDEHQ